MGPTSTRILKTIATAALALAAITINADEIRLQVGVTGSNNLTGLRDPVTVAKLPQVSSLLQSIADEPRGAGYIDQSLGDSPASLDLLLDLGILKPWQGRYAISFNYLTIEDHELLLTALAPFAEDLAQSYRGRWPEFETLFAAYDAPGVAMNEVAYAVIGAISLDWDGLDITAAKGLRITADNLPAGRDFILWAKEVSSEVNTRGLYWGSHNRVAGGVQFTTFGDHHTLPRLGLPDLLWSARKRAADTDSASPALWLSFANALAPYLQDDFLRDAGAILRLLRQRPATGQSVSDLTGIGKDRSDAILIFLTELRYVREQAGTFVLTSPYFSAADKPMIEAVRALSGQLMDGWLDSNAADIELALQRLSAIRYGIAYRQLFTEIWHYLFGMTNRALVQSGHLADPYADTRLSKGMIPFTFDVELLQLQTELRN